MPPKNILGNRGAAIVTVLIGMLFVTALGSALLFTSYTSYNMKQTERIGKQTFYNAETAMSEVRAGLQGVVTDAVASAYTTVLVAYNDNAVNPNKFFHEQFIQELMKWTGKDGIALFSVGSKPHGDDGLYSFNPKIPHEFIRPEEAAHTEFTCTSGGAITITRNKESEISHLTLKSCGVRYEANGFESHIQTDIVISMPSFEYALSEYSLSGIPEFAIIANQELIHHGTGRADFEIEGNAYAGKLSLENGITPLKISDGTLICGGLVSVTGGTTRPTESRLIVDDSATLWANQITVGANSSIQLEGDTYVADDLELAGNHAAATLSGHYYGFGLSDPNRLNAAQAGDTSSSILVNGTHTSLDLSALQGLMLAGNSYISEGSANLIMGQSISVKSDQLAYLIPQTCVSIPNPSLYTGADPAYTIAFDTPLWTIDGVPKTLRSYGITAQPFHSTMSNEQRVLYLFMEFDTRDHANAYFRDYFSQNTSALNQYLQQYVTLKTGTQSIRTAGNTYHQKNPNDQEFDLLPALADFNTLELSAKRLADMYHNLCVTLSPNNAASTAKSPYEFVVNQTAIQSLSKNTTYFLNAKGETSALIVKGNLTVDNSIDETVRAIICTGDMTVSRDFKGILIAKGTITLNADLTSDRSAVVAALSAPEQNGFKHFIEFLNLGAPIDKTNPPGTQSWEPRSLVTYDNWTKS